MKKDIFFSRNYLIALGLSTYPVSLLFTSNYLNTNLLMYLIPLAVVYLFVTCIYFVFYTLRNIVSFKNSYLSSSIVTIVFFIYGIFYSFFNSRDTFFSFLGSHRYLLTITFIFLIGIIYFINTINKSSTVYKFLLIFLVSLNILPFLTVFDYLFLKETKKNSETSFFENNSIKSFPNIYYIILDGYGSNSSIKKYLNYDNSRFTEELKGIGFKVQKNAYSNYCRTLFSLTSTLNLNYVQKFIKPKVTQENLNRYLGNNRVSEILKSHGYTYYLFDSGFGLKNKYDQNDVLIKTNELNFLQNLLTTSDNDVLNSFINNSILKISKNHFFITLSVKSYAFKILNVFLKLPDLALNNRKKFVFAHIISPHPPFLFDKFGNIGVYGTYDPTTYGNFNWNTKLYVEQMKFINRMTINVLKDIIKNDREDKIIILQGDHGSRTILETDIFEVNQEWVQEEYSILNAIYISKNGYSKEVVYKNWEYSSINTFRLIFNQYFNFKLPMLKDEKYYSKLNEPYHFETIK